MVQFQSYVTGKVRIVNPNEFSIQSKGPTDHFLVGLGSHLPEKNVTYNEFFFDDSKPSKTTIFAFELDLLLETLKRQSLGYILTGIDNTRVGIYDYSPINSM